VDEFAKNVLVGSENENFLEVRAFAVRTRSAQPILVQGVNVEKGRPARRAVNVRLEGLNLLQAVVTNRNTGKRTEGLLANPAIIWKK
jgi:hypothetical protein